MEQELTEGNTYMDVDETKDLTVGVNIIDEKLRPLLKECMALLDMVRESSVMFNVAVSGEPHTRPMWFCLQNQIKNVHAWH